jgi:hypothetical protein
MFRRAIRGRGPPKYLSSDHDPLYRFHQWTANLRILQVTESRPSPTCRYRTRSSSDWWARYDASTSIKSSSGRQ